MIRIVLSNDLRPRLGQVRAPVTVVYGWHQGMTLTRAEAERIYALDAGLRPEGKLGALARSIEGYATYFERWAEVWERQAFTRARCIAGDPVVGAELLRRLDPLVLRWAR